MGYYSKEAIAWAIVGLIVWGLLFLVPHKDYEIHIGEEMHFDTDPISEIKAAEKTRITFGGKTLD